MRMKDKVTIITGGTGDIGLGIAERIGKEGSAVVLADLNPTAGEKAVERLQGEDIKAIFVQTDVANEEQVIHLVKTTVEQFGKVTNLVNCAGMTSRKSVLELSLEEWHKVFAVNLDGPFLLCKYAIPEIEKNGGGSIVNIGSWHAEKHMTRSSAYAASKAGLLALTRQMALDCAPLNIRVNSICPSSVDTPMFQNFVQQASDPEDALNQYLQFQPFGRLGTVEDIAHACLFMLSHEASYVSGQNLMVDGAAIQKIARPLSWD
ncbi:SDR family NAD(P)-dependent oxidoreductase [Niallia sp. Krafla_26]|uniref:SDR family NAD(P)-dependent oxidoreductase n=1 Tax=Niallia sp. Krafla_26 TaxID=3064703 RepID=UPI003D16B700